MQTISLFTRIFWQHPPGILLLADDVIFLLKCFSALLPYFILSQCNLVVCVSRIRADLFNLIDERGV